MGITAKGTAMKKKDEKDSKLKVVTLEQLQLVAGGARRRSGRSAN
jgi:hypothetical protein